MGQFDRVIDAVQTKKKIKSKPYNGVHIASTKKNPVNAMVNHPMYSPLEITKHTTSKEMAEFITSLPRYQEMVIVVEEKLDLWLKLKAKA